MTDKVTPTQADRDLIDRMATRFLTWKLPEDFNPDAGISFKAEYNENTDWPLRHEPSGTNLFDYTQAREMVEHMLAGEATQAAEIAELKAESLDVHSANERRDALDPNILRQAADEIERLREGLEQAAHNLHAAAKLHQCPGAHKAEQLARKALDQKP